jgi:hypothetical protein
MRADAGLRARCRFLMKWRRLAGRDGAPMTTIMMQLGDMPITIQGIQAGMLFGMFVGLSLMLLYPKGRPNDAFTWMTVLLSVGSLAIFGISKQPFF